MAPHRAEAILYRLLSNELCLFAKTILHEENLEYNLRGWFHGTN